MKKNMYILFEMEELNIIALLLYAPENSSVAAVLDAALDVADVIVKLEKQ